MKEIIDQKEDHYLFNAKMTYCPTMGSRGSAMQVKTFYEILMESSKPEIRRKVEAIRSEADPKRQREMKSGLPCFIPFGIYEGDKGKDSLKQPSGFISIDIDKDDNPEFEGFDNLKNLLRPLPFIAFCAHSVRGQGYYCLIPIKDTQHAEGLAAMIYEGFGRCGLKLDESGKNINRLRFLSYDPCPYINTGAIPFDSLFPFYYPYSRTVADKRGLNSRDIFQLEQEILPEIEKRGLDITGNYKEWFEIICAIKNIYAGNYDRGLDIAKRISSYSPKFSERAVIKEYNKTLTYPYTLATIVHYFQMAAGKSPGRVSAQDDFAGISEEDLQDE